MLTVGSSFLKPIFFSILMVSVISLNAQFRIFKGVDEIEVTIGPSLISLYNENIRKDIRQPKVGLIARVGLLYKLNERITLSTNLAYEKKGSKISQNVWYYDPSIDSTNCQCTVSLGESDYNSNLNYVSVISTIRLHSKGIGLYIDAGLFINYLVKAQGVRENSWDNTIEYSYLMNNFKKYDAGISLSVGYQFQINGRLSFSIQLMNNYGLLNINNTKVVEGFSRTNSLSFQTGLNYKFNKSKSL